MLHFFKPAGTNRYTQIDPTMNRPKQLLTQSNSQPTAASEAQEAPIQNAHPEDYQEILDLQTSLDFWKLHNGLKFNL